jgi:hypothetical protein
MPENKPIEIFISKQGEVRHVHSTEASQLTSQLPGERTTRRASHVEPTAELRPEACTWLLTAASSSLQVCRQTVDAPAGPDHFKRLLMNTLPNSWWADLTPVNGPVFGPFDTNTEALNAELKWLSDNGSPVSTK